MLELERPVESVKTEAGMSTQTDTGTGHLLPDSGTTTDTGKPATDAGLHIDAGMGLKSFPVGGPPDPGPGGVWVTISGEVNALTGYPFPPDWVNDTYMYDGWQFNIEAYIVIVDNIVLWSDPNLSATNQSLHGPRSRTSRGRSSSISTRGADHRARGRRRARDGPRCHPEPERQRRRGVRSDGTTYGFGFSTIPAGTPFAGYTGEVVGNRDTMRTT